MITGLCGILKLKNPAIFGVAMYVAAVAMVPFSSTSTVALFYFLDLSFNTSNSEITRKYFKKCYSISRKEKHNNQN